MMSVNTLMLLPNLNTLYKYAYLLEIYMKISKLIEINNTYIYVNHMI